MNSKLVESAQKIGTRQELSPAVPVVSTNHTRRQNIDLIAVTAGSKEYGPRLTKMKQFSAV